MLELDAGALGQLLSVFHRMQSQYLYGTGCGCVEAFQAIEQRRLSRTVGADNAEDLILPDVETHPVHGQEVSEASGDIAT